MCECFNKTVFQLLEEIVSINLSKNRLVNLPSAIGQMIRLKNLNLSYNQLEVFPESLGDNQLLEVLDISNNMIEGAL